jgi:hypothetical protein
MIFMPSVASMISGWTSGMNWGIAPQAAGMGVALSLFVLKPLGH